MPPLRPLLRPLIELAPAAVCALIGGYVCALIDLPAPWISGAMLGAMLSAFIRPLPEMPPRMRDLAFLLAGTTMGSGVTPETLQLMAKAPLSFAVLALCIVGIMGLSALWLTSAHGWRADDALLASAPGALSTALALAADRGGDVVGVAVVQTVRLFVLVAVLPTFIGWLEGSHGAGFAAGASMSWGVTALVLAGGALCGFVLHRLKFTAAMMLGAAVFGATLHGAGFVQGGTPAPVAIGGFVLVGVMIATRTRGITWRAVADYAAASVATLAIGAFVTLALSLVAVWLIGVRFGVAILAFAPGGVEAMTLLSMSLAYDPLYVAAHHIARFMSIGLCLPLWFRLMDRGPPS